ncbi:hypothetical protein Musp01_31840 [Muricauda sp. NBRC 101325]|nr:hypothetical protein Musp01_31840 [Muricauda sp. NBRC 101325]
MVVRQKNKKRIIILGFIIGWSVVLFEANLSHSDTATIGDEFGFDIPDKKLFILRSIVFSSIGAFHGWCLYMVFELIKTYFLKKKSNIEE